MELSFSHVHALLKEKQVGKIAKKLIPYLEELKAITARGIYDRWESSLCLPNDTKLPEEIARITKPIKTGGLKYIIHIGIGGSMLGVKALYEALEEYREIKELLPRIFFLDTTNGEYLETLLNFLKKHVTKPNEILIHIASKSGKTTETIANAHVLVSLLKKKFRAINERITIATDTGSPLEKAARDEGFFYLPIPIFVGGRFSTFTSVGLIPLLLAGFDIQKILKGAREMLELCLSPNITKNPALLSAIFLYLHSLEGKSIHETFFFEPELETLGKWYRGLMSESIGKATDLRGKPQRTGITPVTSIGSVDLHGFSQLTFAGPRDKTTCFVGLKEFSSGPHIKQQSVFSKYTSPTITHTPGEILGAIYEGTKRAYAKDKIPFTEVTFKKISEASLGTFMQWKMVEVMLLGKLMNINAFNQPNVESYKEETRKILKGRLA